MQRYECAKCGNTDFWLYPEWKPATGICNGCGTAVALGGPESAERSSPPGWNPPGQVPGKPDATIERWRAYAREYDLKRGAEPKRASFLERNPDLLDTMRGGRAAAERRVLDRVVAEASGAREAIRKLNANLDREIEKYVGSEHNLQSAGAKAHWAKLSPEQRRERTAAARAKRFPKPEQRSKIMFNSPEFLSRRAAGMRKFWASKTPEQRREHMRKAWEGGRAKGLRDKGISPPVHAGVASPAARPGN